jgi:N-[(2S)-2-amino-2-carboxyethyl]-L-glutamate dehydrogenase
MRLLEDDGRAGAGAFLHLTRDDVVRCCDSIDLVDVVARTLALHARDQTALPEEAYLGWQTPGGAAARSLAMPGALLGDEPAYGMKMINGALSNPAIGLSRSQGFTFLFDPATARPVVMMEAAFVSAMRTAAVTAVTALHLGCSSITTMALLGCGTLARAHLDVLIPALPALERLQVFDLDTRHAEAFAAEVRRGAGERALAVEVMPDAETCVRDAQLVVPVTTVSEGYIAHAWLTPGALIAHVSLDDVLPEVAEAADILLVDDWSLVSHDDRRLLGRMWRGGQLAAPDGGLHNGHEPARPPRRVDATIGDVLIGRHPGRGSEDDIILSNPFGMAILDIAVAARIHRTAVTQGLGTLLSL